MKEIRNVIIYSGRTLTCLTLDNYSLHNFGFSDPPDKRSAQLDTQIVIEENRADSDKLRRTNSTAHNTMIGLLLAYSRDSLTRCLKKLRNAHEKKRFTSYALIFYSRVWKNEKTGFGIRFTSSSLLCYC